MNPNILCIDDNSRNLEILKELLDEDFEFRSASSGEEGLRCMQNSPADIVILDIMMHPMSGIEVCRQLKDDPRTKDIPVILVTAKTHEKERLEGLEAGAVAYVTKPFDPDTLLDLVENHFPR